MVLISPQDMETHLRMMVPVQVSHMSHGTGKPTEQGLATPMGQSPLLCQRIQIAGFSIVTYTGNGSAGATVGHGLGVAPSMVIVKERQNANAWCVYHSSIGATKFLRLNGTDAEETQTDIWNDTEPSSSAPYVFTVGDAPATNRNANNLVAYCFAEIADFSKFGSYTGNGSATGPSVTTDFEPTFLLVKRSDSTGPWVCYDYARSPSNPRNKYLFWNDTSVEGTGLDVDFNSTSFQIKSSNANVNASGGTYIYMCIA
jgi:hypothetical protein